MNFVSGCLGALIPKTSPDYLGLGKYAYCVSIFVFVSLCVLEGIGGHRDNCDMRDNRAGVLLAEHRDRTRDATRR